MVLKSSRETFEQTHEIPIPETKDKVIISYSRRVSFDEVNEQVDLKYFIGGFYVANKDWLGFTRKSIRDDNGEYHETVFKTYQFQKNLEDQNLLSLLEKELPTYVFNLIQEGSKQVRIRIKY